MADAVVKTDVKQGQSAEASTAPAAQAAGNPPTGESPVPQAVPQDKRVPYDRFQQVIQEKNEYAAKLAELERRLQVNEVAIGAKTKVDGVTRHIEKLVASGMDRGAAEILVETYAALAEEKINQKVSPLEQKAMAQEARSWTHEFAKSHPDYDKLEGKMYDLYKTLPEQTQAMIASDPMGLDFLYSKVKLSEAANEIKAAELSGATAAYTTKDMKQAMSSQAGASATPPQGITRERVAEMSLEEYSKHRQEIMDALIRRKK